MTSNLSKVLHAKCRCEQISWPNNSTLHVSIRFSSCELPKSKELEAPEHSLSSPEKDCCHLKSMDECKNMRHGEANGHERLINARVASAA